MHRQTNCCYINYFTIDVISNVVTSNPEFGFILVLKMLVSIVPLQMWSIACWGSPAVHRWHIHRTLYCSGGNTAVSKHHRSGQDGSTSLAAEETEWETAGNRWEHF